MFSFLDPILIHIHDLLTHVDDVLPPALVVVAITLLTRLALHPMNRRNTRGMLRRRDLQPRLDALREEHKDDQQAFSKAMLELHRQEKVPLAPGCLSIFIQLPIFSMVYRLFTAPEINGQHNQLLDHSFLGTPLSAHLLTAEPGQRWVFLTIMAITLVVAAFAAVQMRRHMRQDRERMAALSPKKELTPQQEAMSKTMEQATAVLPFMSFMTVTAVAALPLAAGIYLATSSSWGVLERASLRRLHGPMPAQP
ncbi:YidC/Oxa1 family membrane protein insertase [Ornithinimicrobium sp. Y1847]|uniref:YidC/Oxa1 family membrane protein insertase n=1 Tax=unclassified Ornithinimicrobium TaxID=2615080 RepID=UPI003B678436